VADNVQSGQNVALVTQTLVANASSTLINPGSLTLPQFLDLCALCEAVVLLDRLETLDSSCEDGGHLAGWLAEHGLYRSISPSLSRQELALALVRLPEELASRIILDPGKPDKQRRARHHGAPKALDYSTGLDNLLAQIDGLSGYRSAGDSPIREQMYRAVGYLVTAAAYGLDYFPDSDRVPFLAGTLRRTYRSLPRQLYDKVADSLDEPLNGGAIAELTALSTIPIPPISALVLSRSASLDQLPEQLLRAREEFARYRRYFADFKLALQTSDTIHERRRVLREYRTLLANASGPRPEIVSMSAMLNLAEKTVAAASGAALPTSYSALLLTQPADWIRQWWQRRPLAILFRLDGKLPRLSEYQVLVDKLWGRQAQHRLLDQLAVQGPQLRALMSEAEPV
jgi:hypothetical protein